MNCLSFSIKLLESQLLRKPLHEIYAKSVGNNNKKMRMMVSCLQGGKTVGSKCKVNVGGYRCLSIILWGNNRI